MLLRERISGSPGIAEGRGYWLIRLMGASLRSFTHPTKICGSYLVGWVKERSDAPVNPWNVVNSYKN